MKRKDLARRATSAALAACMMFTLSAPALAESTDALMQLSMTRRSAVSVLDAENSGSDLSAPLLQLNLANGSIEVYFENGKQYAKQGESKWQCDKLVVTSNSTTTSNTLTIKGGSVAAKVTLNNVNIDVSEYSAAAVSVSGDVELTLEGVNVLKSGANCAGLQKEDDGVLTIDGTGSLEAHGGAYGAGIGAGQNANYRNAHNIIINGGTINAYGGDQGAGIGGANSGGNTNNGIAEDITINDGNVFAKGGNYGAGIGGCGSGASDYNGGRGEKITITGGVVTAESGGNGAAAIGGSENALGRDIKITGGTVTVQKNGGKWIGGREDHGGTGEIDFSGTAATIIYLNEDGTEYKKTATVDYGITVTYNKKAISVTSANCGNILGNGTLSYDPVTKKLTSNGTIQGLLSINAPGVDVELNGQNFALQDGGLYGNLTIENANNVTISSQNYAAVEKDVNVTCTGNLTVKTNDSSWAAIGRNLTVHSAESVQIESKGNSAVGGDVKIECTCPVTLKNNGRSSVASSISCPEGSVYYTSETDNTFVDPRLGTVPSGYVRIGQKTLYNINTAEDATIKLQGQSTDLTTAFAGEEVTVTAADRENADFTGWTDLDSVLTPDQLTAQEVTFTMPDSMVVLTARYKALQSITLENGKAYAGGEEITTAKKGTEVTIKAENLDGKVFDHWEIVSGNVTLEDANKAETTFTMPAEPISLKAVYNTIHNIDTTFCTADPASAIVGTEITVTAESREGYEFDGWAVSDGVELYNEDGLTAKFIMPDDGVTIEAKYKQYHSIEVSKGVATDAEGNPISSAVEGTEIWIEIDREQRNPDEFEFNRWVSDPEDLEIADRKAERTSFTMPDDNVTVEAKFLHLREITVHDGTTYVEGEEGGIAKAGQTVTVKADEIPGLKFDHWTVDAGSIILDDEKASEATFEMVNEPVELTAHYKAMVTVFSDPAKFSEDTGEESVTEWADVGETATITAEIDEETFPSMVFDYWEIVTPADLKTEYIESQTIAFEVPKSEVKLVAHWKSGALSPITDPDAPFDPDFGVDPVDDGSGIAGAAVAGVALGGAAVWGGYEIATRVILNDLLPEGAAIPANRGELALLMWQTAGKPEPAAQPAFTDVADAELAKAAQWCVEQGLLDAKDGKFDPAGWMPKYKTIEVWKKAFPKQ